MKKRLLFCAFLGSLTACQRESDIQPNPASLSSEVAGTYRTNFYLDPSCVAISASQMPFAELKVESDSTITLVYTRLYPDKIVSRVPNISLSRQPDAIVFRVADLGVGTLQTDRIFTDNGMEKQGKLLRILMPNTTQSPLYFAGFK
jgi:hypothetical protein